MSKKRKKISLVFIGFLLTLLTIVSFAEAPEAPNQLITENPYKEVKTVEANKNRDYAEMKISVNKINIMDIIGLESKEGEIIIQLPETELKKYIQEKNFYITQKLENFSEKLKKNEEEITEKIESEVKNNLLYIKNFDKKKEIYILQFLFNKNKKEIEKIWKVIVKEPKSVLGTCRIEIKSWDVIKKYIQQFKTTHLVFYLGNNNSILKVTDGKNPSFKNGINLNGTEFEHMHIGNNDNVIDGCFKYGTGSYVKTKDGNPLFDIVSGGNHLKDWEPMDTTGLLGRTGYIVNSEFSTNYSTNLTSGFTIAKKRLGYSGNWNHILMYQLLFKASTWEEAIREIERSLEHQKFHQKFLYTIRDVNTLVFRNEVDISVLPTLTSKEGRVQIIYKNPLFQGGSGDTASITEKTFFGRVRIFPKESAKMLTGSNSFGISNSNRYEQYKVITKNNTLIPITKDFINDLDEVQITATIDGMKKKTESIILTTNSMNGIEGPIKPVYFSKGGTVSGTFQIMVDLPSISDSKGGVDIGIDHWDGKSHNVMIEMFYPRKGIKNIIDIDIPELDSTIYFDKTSLPNNLNNKILEDELENFTSGELFKIDIKTKDYDLKILGEDFAANTNLLAIKIPKKVELTFKDSKNNFQTVTGYIVPSKKSEKTVIINNHFDDFYYISPAYYSNRENPTDIFAEIQLNVDLSSIEDSKKNGVCQLFFNNGNLLSIGKRYDDESFKEIISGINYTLNYFSEKRGEVTINLDNPIVSGTYGAPLGRIRVYSNSSSLTPLMGYLGTNDEIIITGIKNNQYKSGEIKGRYIPAIPNNFGGNNLEITLNNGIGDKKNIRTLNLNQSEYFNGMMSTVYYENNGIEVGVDYQESTRSKYATDISLRNWDLSAKNIKIKMKHPLIENNFNIKIPEFDGEVYYNKNIAQVAPTKVDYLTKTLYGRFIREHSGKMGIKFNIGTKDYDLRILGKRNGNINLKLKIPKQVILKVRDDLGVEKQIPFYTEILSLTSGIKAESSNYYCIYAPNDGIENNSEINATIVLKTLLKNDNISWNRITGENLNLVSIGANSNNGEKKFTIIDNVNLEMELANFNETIDVSNINISEKVYSRNGYYGLIQNENKLILKDENRKILETTFEELTRTKKEILEAGISIRYNCGLAQDINRNQFEFEKIKGINYNKTLRLEVHTSNGQLLYYIDFKIINKAGFEILPGKGKLDFGYFFPGDVKRAESLIEFKNPNNANINISLSSTNNYKMFKKGGTISPNTTIVLNDFQIKDLKKGSNNTNNFKISGIARTTKDTLPGEYSGELDVIITIVP